jgi:hypothetical protein
MLVIVLVLHTIETTNFYGIYNRWYGSNENTVHDYYMYSIKLGNIPKQTIDRKQQIDTNSPN